LQIDESGIDEYAITVGNALPKNDFAICIALQMTMIDSTTASKSAQKFETNFN
jgi:hypothetical protein